VLRAWSGATKCARLCVLEQEQSCGKYWWDEWYCRLLLCSFQFEGKLLEQEQSCGKYWWDEWYCRLLLCSFQFEGKFKLNCAVDCTQFITETHTQARTVSRNTTIPSLSSLFPVQSSLPLTTQRHAAPLLL